MTQKRKLDDSEVIPTAEVKAARLETHMLENRNACGTQLFTRDLKKYHYASSKSKAAKFNAHTLRKLQAAVDKDPAYAHGLLCPPGRISGRVSRKSQGNNR